MDLHEEMQRSKRIMDEKHYEASRLHDESSKKSEGNLGLRDECGALEREIDMLKQQRADDDRHGDARRDARLRVHVR